MRSGGWGAVMETQEVGGDGGVVREAGAPSPPPQQAQQSHVRLWGVQSGEIERVFNALGARDCPAAVALESMAWLCSVIRAFVKLLDECAASEPYVLHHVRAQAIAMREEIALKRLIRLMDRNLDDKLIQASAIRTVHSLLLLYGRHDLAITSDAFSSGAQSVSFSADAFGAQRNTHAVGLAHSNDAAAPANGKAASGFMSNDTMRSADGGGEASPMSARDQEQHEHIRQLQEQLLNNSSLSQLAVPAAKARAAAVQNASALAGESSPDAAASQESHSGQIHPPQPQRSQQYQKLQSQSEQRHEQEASRQDLGTTNEHTSRSHKYALCGPIPPNIGERMRRPRLWIFEEIVANDVIQLVVEALIQHAFDREVPVRCLRFAAALAICDVECRTLLGNFGVLDGISQALDVFENVHGTLVLALDCLHALFGWPFNMAHLLELTASLPLPTGTVPVDSAWCATVCNINVGDDAEYTGGQGGSAGASGKQQDQQQQQQQQQPNYGHSPRSLGLSFESGSVYFLDYIERFRIPSEFIVPHAFTARFVFSGPIGRRLFAEYGGTMRAKASPVVLHEQNCAHITASGILIRLIHMLIKYLRNTYKEHAVLSTESEFFINQSARYLSSQGLPSSGGGRQSYGGGNKGGDGGGTGSESSGVLSHEDAFRCICYLAAGLRANRLAQKHFRNEEGVQTLLALASLCDFGARQLTIIALRWSLSDCPENQAIFAALGGLSLAVEVVDEVLELAASFSGGSAGGSSSGTADNNIVGASNQSHCVCYHDGGLQSQCATGAQTDIHRINPHLFMSNTLWLMYECLVKNDVNQDTAARMSIGVLMIRVIATFPVCPMVCSAACSVLRLLTYVSEGRTALLESSVIPSLISSYHTIADAVMSLDLNPAGLFGRGEPGKMQGRSIDFHVNEALLCDACGVSVALLENPVKALVMLVASRSVALRQVQADQTFCARFVRAFAFVVNVFTDLVQDQREMQSNEAAALVRLIDSKLRLLKHLTDEIGTVGSPVQQGSVALGNMSLNGGFSQQARTRSRSRTGTATQGGTTSGALADATAALGSRALSAATGGSGHHQGHAGEQQSLASAVAATSRDGDSSASGSAAAAAFVESLLVVGVVATLLEAGLLDVLKQVLTCLADDVVVVEQTLKLVRVLVEGSRVDDVSGEFLDASKAAALFDAVLVAWKRHPKMAMISSSARYALEAIDARRFAMLEQSMGLPADADAHHAGSSGVGNLPLVGRDTLRAKAFAKSGSLKGTLARKMSHSGRGFHRNSSGAASVAAASTGNEVLNAPVGNARTTSTKGVSWGKSISSSSGADAAAEHGPDEEGLEKKLSRVGSRGRQSLKKLFASFGSSHQETGSAT